MPRKVRAKRASTFDALFRQKTAARGALVDFADAELAKLEQEIALLEATVKGEVPLPAFSSKRKVRDSKRKVS